MKRLRIGIIGAGSVAESSHLPVLSGLKDIELELCDVAPDRLEPLARRFDVRRTWTDHKSLIDSEPDALWVLVPQTLMYEVGRTCLQSGIPTFLEKPPGMNSSECELLWDAAASRGTHHMVGFTLRFSPVLRALREAIENQGHVVGMLAESRLNSADYYRKRGVDEDVLARILPAQFIHLVDIARYLFGEVEDIHSISAAHGDRHPNVFGVLLGFSGQKAAVLHHSLLGPVRQDRLVLLGGGICGEIRRSGGNQSVTINTPDGDVAPRVDIPRDAPTEPYMAGFWDQACHFVEAIRRGESPGFPATTLADALGTMRVIDQLSSP